MAKAKEKRAKSAAAKPRVAKAEKTSSKKGTTKAPISANATANGVAGPAANGHPPSPEAAMAAIGTVKSNSGIDLTEKIKELLRLAQEQGYLTYNDINDALPDNIVSPEELDDIYIKLRNLDVAIVDQAEVDLIELFRTDNIVRQG